MKRSALRAPERLDRPFADPLVQRLFPPLASGVHWGIERVRAALGDLGDPQDRYASVHIGGTNGKGSVASTVHAILENAGHRVGLYTSPHLCSFRERFILDGRPVAEDVLLERVSEVRDAVLTHELTFFEAVTVLAFQLFAEEGIEVAVVEVGLGGRLDATNVLTPLVTAITNIAMDHADYLGGTLPEIAREKGGIIKAGVPVTTAEADEEIVSLLGAIAHERGAPFRRVDPEQDLKVLEVCRDHTAFQVRTTRSGVLSLQTPLIGRHQAVNAALAVATCEALPDTLRPGEESLTEGIAAVRWPGRDQVEEIEGVTWIFDVAHNVAGARSLVDTLQRLDLPRPWTALVGVLGDKDWRAMLPPLFTLADHAWLTVPPSGPPERRWNPVAAREALGTPASGARCAVEIEIDFDLALSKARESADAGTVVVTGSVYTVGAALERLGCRPFEGDLSTS